MDRAHDELSNIVVTVLNGMEPFCRNKQRGFLYYLSQ